DTANECRQHAAGVGAEQVRVIAHIAISAWNDAGAALQVGLADRAGQRYALGPNDARELVAFAAIGRRWRLRCVRLPTLDPRRSGAGPLAPMTYPGSALADDPNCKRIVARSVVALRTGRAILAGTRAARMDARVGETVEQER